MSAARRIVVIAIAFEGALIVFAATIGVLIDRSPWGLLRFEWNGVLWGIIATLPLLAGLKWCLNSHWPPFQRLIQTVKETLIPLFAECTTVDIVVISISAGVGEEILFRGLIQPSLSDVIGPLLGLLVASALFGVVHLVTPTYAILAGLIGAYLGWLVMASGNLMLAIVAHALYDFVALRRLSRWSSDGIRPET